MATVNNDVDPSIIFNDESAVINDRYKIIETINKGLYGHLYKVQDLNEKNKIKKAREYRLIPIENIEIAKDHACLLVQMNSSFIVKYLDLFCDKERFLVVMEYNEDDRLLEDVLEEYKKVKNPLNNDDIQTWCIQMLKGLDYLHKNDMIHRAIKPTNILVRENDIILGDLGLERDSVIMTEHYFDAGIGTLNYMAPEIIKNFINYNNTIDSWSFGCVLYEIITLKRLFNGRKPEIISEVLKFKEVKLKANQTIPIFETILKKSLSFSVENRATCSQLLDILTRDSTLPIALDLSTLPKVKKPIQIIKSFRLFNQTISSMKKKNSLTITQSSINLSVKDAAATKPMNKIDPTSNSNQSLNRVATATVAPAVPKFQTTNQVYMKEGERLFKSSNYKESLKYFDKVIAAQPNNPEAYFKKARCLRSLSKYHESIEFFDKCLNLNENHLSAMNYKAFSMKAIGKFEEAKLLFEKANDLNIDPTDIDSYFNKALSLYGLDLHADAIDYYDEILEKEPKNSLALSNKGILLKNLNQTDEALKCYNKSIEIDPNYAYVHNNKGLLLVSLKKHEDSLICFNETLRLDPICIDALRNKGYTLNELKKHDEALKCFNKIIELDPKNSAAWNAKGSTLYCLNKLKDSVEAFTKVIELQPNNIDTYIHVAGIFEEKKIYKEALKCYDAILKINPEHAEATKNKEVLIQLMNESDNKV